jgi:hypothetical protein
MPVYKRQVSLPNSVTQPKIHLNIINPTTSWVFLAASFSLAFPPTTYTRTSFPHSCYMPHPSHPPRLDYSNYTWRRVQITKLLVMQFIHSSVTSSHFSSTIFLSSLFSNTLSLCFYLNARDQVSQFHYRGIGIRCLEVVRDFFYSNYQLIFNQKIKILPPRTIACSFSTKLANLN